MSDNSICDETNCPDYTKIKKRNSDCRNCVQTQRKCDELERNVSHQEIRIKMLTDQLAKMENMYKKSLDESEKNQHRLRVAMQKLNNYLEICKQLEDEILKYKKEKKCTCAYKNVEKNLKNIKIQCEGELNKLQNTSSENHKKEPVEDTSKTYKIIIEELEEQLRSLDNKYALKSSNCCNACTNTVQNDNESELNKKDVQDSLDACNKLLNECEFGFKCLEVECRLLKNQNESLEEQIRNKLPGISIGTSTDPIQKHSLDKSTDYDCLPKQKPNNTTGRNCYEVGCQAKIIDAIDSRLKSKLKNYATEICLCKKTIENLNKKLNNKPVQCDSICKAKTEMLQDRIQKQDKEIDKLNEIIQKLLQEKGDDSIIKLPQMNIPKQNDRIEECLDETKRSFEDTKNKSWTKFKETATQMSYNDELNDTGDNIQEMSYLPRTSSKLEESKHPNDQDTSQERNPKWQWNVNDKSNKILNFTDNYSSIYEPNSGKSTWLHEEEKNEPDTSEDNKEFVIINLGILPRSSRTRKQKKTVATATTEEGEKTYITTLSIYDEITQTPLSLLKKNENYLFASGIKDPILVPRDKVPFSDASLILTTYDNEDDLNDTIRFQPQATRTADTGKTVTKPSNTENVDRSLSLNERILEISTLKVIFDDIAHNMKLLKHKNQMLNADNDNLKSTMDTLIKNLENSLKKLRPSDLNLTKTSSNFKKTKDRTKCDCVSIIESVFNNAPIFLNKSITCTESTCSLIFPQEKKSFKSKIPRSTLHICRAKQEAEKKECQAKIIPLKPSRTCTLCKTTNLKQTSDEKCICITNFSEESNAQKTESKEEINNVNTNENKSILMVENESKNVDDTTNFNDVIDNLESSKANGIDDIAKKLLQQLSQLSNEDPDNLARRIDIIDGITNELTDLKESFYKKESELLGKSGAEETKIEPVKPGTFRRLFKSKK